MMFRVVVSQIFPVNPIQPAISQLNIFGQPLLRRDLHRQYVAIPRMDNLRYVQFELVVHPHDLRSVCQLAAVQPDIRAVVNALEDQRINVAARRSRERGSIPPILFP